MSSIGRASKALLGAAFLLFALVPACAPPASPAASAGATSPREVSRDAAIESARRDASLNHRELWVSDIVAQRLGSFWIVELRTANGSGLRYAISTHDGSIRERSMFQ